MENIRIKMYFEAARQVMNNPFLAEKWLDENSHNLKMEINSIKEAKEEILKLS